MLITSRSSVISFTLRVLGTFTSMPDWSTGAVTMKIIKSTSTSSPQTVKRINNAPHCSKKADERRGGARNRQPRQIALKACQLFGVGDLHGSLDRGGVLYHPARNSALTAIFFEPTLKHPNQRARTELFRYRAHVLQALCLAESTHETATLDPGPREQTPFGKDDR